MMTWKRIPPFFVSCLVACLLVVGGVLTAQAVEHSQHHSQHHPSTHATLLCSWFCAAGQTMETVRVSIEGPVESLITVDQWRFISPQEHFLILPISRAPPSCL
ncbi:MAG: hypothetical protein AB7P17_12825 [Nitrospirales bacterium]